MKIDILDQLGSSPPTSAFILDWDEGVPTTARDLIRERVRIEYDVAHEPRMAAPTISSISPPRPRGARSKKRSTAPAGGSRPTSCS
jgi:hypothetical protein